MGLLVCIPLLLGLVASRKEYFDTSEGIVERFHSGDANAERKIAVLEVSGVIMEGDGFAKKQINRVLRDPAISGVVLRINSPGGTVTGSDYLYHHLTKLREERNIPLVVSMGSIAASGGYYVAMAAGDQKDAIFAEPTTTTGSIGVIIPHYDLSGLLDRFEIRDDSVVSHPRKQLLSMTRRATEEERQILQDYVRQTFERFKEIVVSGRPYFREHPEALTELATGEIFSAKVAKERHLVDQIGFIEDAIERVAELAGLDAEKVRVVSYRKPPTLLEAMGAFQSKSVDRQQSLMTMLVPRAYYLFTTAPLLISSSSLE
jgi:protease-4